MVELTLVTSLVAGVLLLPFWCATPLLVASPVSDLLAAWSGSSR